MDIHFYENGQVPRPKNEIRIEELEIVVYPDRFRVYVHVKVTPFLERPNLLIAIRNSEGRVISDQFVIETMHNDMEFTLHLRNVTEPAGDYTLRIEVFYETRNPPIDAIEQTFTVPEEDVEEDA